jgi:hypothetical protein
VFHGDITPKDGRDFLMGCLWLLDPFPDASSNFHWLRLYRTGENIALAIICTLKTVVWSLSSSLTSCNRFDALVRAAVPVFFVTYFDANWMFWA